MTEGVASPSQDIRPVVGRKVSNRGLWAFGVVLAVAAGALFGALEGRRMTVTSPAVSVPAPVERGMMAPPPPLAIPPDLEAMRYRRVALHPQDPQEAGSRSPAAPRSSPAAAPNYAPGYVSPAPIADHVMPEMPGMAGPSYVYQAPAPTAAPAPPLDGRSGDSRARASQLSNPATTVPQGTVIQAVLETALNSNHAGFARAIVSRDVSSFDGSRVLIPRGSKLFGEYRADVAQGQNRALIQWRRLTRPDGSIIDVDSPSADPLGRAGVRGKVDSHFFQRFGGAILQSVLDVGVQVAARRASGNTVILALPNSSPSITATRPEEIRPTIKVRQGSSVSVFVGRDLDFTDVEG